MVDAVKVIRDSCRSRLAPTIVAASAFCLAAAVACGGRAPIAAGVFVAVNRDTLGVGGPIDVTVQFVAARDTAALPKDGVVLMRLLFADGEVMANYDHEPEPPTSQWKPGATIRYSKRIFVRDVPYVGGATLVVALASKQTGEKVRLSGAEDLGGRMYRAASLTLRASPSIVMYDDGWYRAEGAAERGEEWRWTSERASLSMPNPQRDSVLYLRVGGSPIANETPQRLTIEKDGRMIRELEVKSGTTDFEVPLTTADLGSAPAVKLFLNVDKTFVPAKLPGGGGDTRTLGVRVFNVYLEPRPAS